MTTHETACKHYQRAANVIQFNPNRYGLSADDFGTARMMADQLENTPDRFRLYIAVWAVKEDRKDILI